MSRARLRICNKAGRKNNFYKLVLVISPESAMTAACKMRRSRHGSAVSFVWSPSNSTSGDEGNGRQRRPVRSAGAGFRWWLEPPGCRAHDHGRTQGLATFVEEPCRGRCTRATPGWWASGIDSSRSRFAAGIGAVDRTCHARRPHVPLALDLQEHGKVGRGVDAPESPRLGSHSGDVVEAERLQLAG